MGCDGNNSCTVELGNLPLLAGCPAGEEWFLVGNAVGGFGAMKYARRLYKDIKTCIVSGLGFLKLSFKIGAVGSPMVAGETSLIIMVDNPIKDSETVLLDNTPLEPNRADQISYSVSYSSTEIIITFNQAVQDGQNYYITYATS